MADAATQNANKYLTPVVKTIEMPLDMVNEITEYAVKVLQESKGDKEISDKMKKFVDENYTPSWCVVVGKTYGSYVTHETKKYLQFNIAHVAFLVWKCG